ncbi:BON domain-containing protein [Orrella sp. NBD-18]|uniref:BON domain-containing protein n=1 Tax=Sheuella amnicola TaxID=2707330 RepID=A0A6B2QZS3_9BURK|nr:BON domain-containing protein [Sheuella amnicola]NDY82257.1 BON domain-containing protein [Sheuella amnicola]
MTFLKRLTRPLACIVLLSGVAVSMQGCVPLVVGGAAAATAGVVVVDRRSAMQQADDLTIELKVNNEMRNRYGDVARINATVYNGVVLLTGESLNQEIKTQAAEIASKIDKVKSVVNQIVVVEEISPFSVITNDTWITSKVIATLATTKEVPSRTIVVTTVRSVVYLMGMVTQHEGDVAAAAAAQVSGVRRVEKLFQIITPAEANRLDSMTGTRTTPKGEGAPIGEGSTGGVQQGGAMQDGGAVEVPAVPSGTVQAIPIQ